MEETDRQTDRQTDRHKREIGGGGGRGRDSDRQTEREEEREGGGGEEVQRELVSSVLHPGNSHSQSPIHALVQSNPSPC